MHRSAPSDRRRNRRNRSRSIREFDGRLPAEERRGIELSQRFRRVQQENRSGVSYRRRYKSACLNLLEHLQFVVAILVNITYPNASQVILQRAGQVQSRINDCRANRLPGRREPLLERIEGESDQSGTDSEGAETVAITSESEGELEVVDRRPAGTWAPGRFSSVRVTASNPLLRRTPRPPTYPPPPRPPTYPPPERAGFSTASSSSSAARTSRSLELPWGVEINPINHSRTDESSVGLEYRLASGAA